MYLMFVLNYLFNLVNEQWKEKIRENLQPEFNSEIREYYCDGRTKVIRRISLFSTWILYIIRHSRRIIY